LWRSTRRALIAAATETTRARNRACAARLQACGLPRRTSWSLRRAVTVPLHDGVSHSSILAGPDGALAVNDLMRLAAVVQPLRILKPHSTRSSAPLEAKSVAVVFQFGAKLGVDQCGWATIARSYLTIAVKMLSIWHHYHMRRALAECQLALRRPKSIASHRVVVHPATHDRFRPGRRARMSSSSSSRGMVIWHNVTGRRVPHKNA